jgi:hypothetical protein
MVFRENNFIIPKITILILIFIILPPRIKKAKEWRILKEDSNQGLKSLIFYFIAFPHNYSNPSALNSMQKELIKKTFFLKKIY